MVAGIPDGVQTARGIVAAQRLMAENPADATSLTERIRRVTQAFDAAGTKWTLVGAHAVGILTEPRGTKDFDFVVEAEKLPRVIERLEETFGPLVVTDLGPAVRVLTLDIDLIRSSTHALFKRALEQTQPAGDWRIPVPELVIALEYLWAVSPWRGLDKRRQDILDLIRVYKTVGTDRIDREELVALAGLSFPGAEAEIADLLGRVDLDEPITI